MNHKLRTWVGGYSKISSKKEANTMLVWKDKPDVSIKHLISVFEEDQQSEKCLTNNIERRMELMVQSLTVLYMIKSIETYDDWYLNAIMEG